MAKLCENDNIDVSMPSSCEFCKCDKDSLYCCPKCSKFYCSLKCYKGPKHFRCSEKFYLEQIQNDSGPTGYQEEEKAPKVDENLKTAASFEDYMEKLKKVLEEKPEDEDMNPQIEVDEDEEVLFDSDEEPEYLSKIIDKTVIDYEKKEMEDINVRLMKAGIGSLLEDDDEQMDRLYNTLTDEEKKTFTKLAEAMHNEETGVGNSCFKKKS